MRAIVSFLDASAARVVVEAEPGFIIERLRRGLPVQRATIEGLIGDALAELPAVRSGRTTPGDVAELILRVAVSEFLLPTPDAEAGLRRAARPREPGRRSAMTTTDGPLVATDETFAHQIVETHAHVAQADRSWTEKVCAMAAARDGSLQVAFGVGKYANRNVFDGYAGVSRGKEQWTVRASRRLSDDVDRIGAGPIDYEIIEPYRRVRFACAANEVVPIAYEWIFEAAVPPLLERRDRQRARRGTALDAEVLRYHQIGLASGWVEVEGVRTEIAPDTWFTTATTRGACARTSAFRPPTSRARGAEVSSRRACRSGSRGARCCSNDPTAPCTPSTTSID